jgi:hypothetical protein
MKQQLLDALRIVIDLAQGNALNFEDCPEDLKGESVRQHEAIGLLEEFWEKEMNG